jgi:hypothetical protein
MLKIIVLWCAEIPMVVNTKKEQVGYYADAWYRCVSEKSHHCRRSSNGKRKVFDRRNNTSQDSTGCWAGVIITAEVRIERGRYEKEPRSESREHSDKDAPLSLLPLSPLSPLSPLQRSVDAVNSRVNGISQGKSAVRWTL